MKLKSKNLKRVSRYPDILKKVSTLSFCFLLLVLFNYQIIRGEYFVARARNNYVRAIPLSSLRGIILDRNGNILAKDRAAFNIAVIPYQIKDQQDSLFKNIAADLNLDKETIYRNYNRNLRFFFSPTDIAFDVGKEKALFLKNKYPRLILINPLPQRTYLYGKECAHILGYVKRASSLPEDFRKYGYAPLQRIGFSGLEQSYDSYLRGEDGGDLLEVDARGNVVGFLGRKRPQKGKDIYLTIDSRLQKLAAESLKNKKGSIIILDAQTGEIIVLYSSPSYDLNAFITGKDLNRLYQDKDSPLINRAIQGSFPIGSLSKPILAVAGLEEKTIIPETTFDCQGRFLLGKASFRCSRAHGLQNTIESLAHSCNVYFYHLGLRLGPEKIKDWSQEFGLSSKTNIDLPYEKKGLVPSPQWKRQRFNQIWYAGDTVNLSIGQGYIQITPLAITMAINSIANGGYLIEPTLLKKIEGHPAIPGQKKPIKASNKNLEIVRKGMREAVNRSTGTARLLRNLRIDISGKTGTAQTSNEPHAWFVGFFPYENPVYTISVFLENGGSSYQAVNVVNNFLSQAKKNNLLELK